MSGAGRAMARPHDWHPLRESDPVPGDPEGIRGHVRHMKKVAAQLRTQAAALTAMADSGDLKGKYADELAESSRGLARTLDAAEGRYREVKNHLSDWADDLEDAQNRADRALRDAKAAQRVVDSRENAPRSGGKGSGGGGSAGGAGNGSGGRDGVDPLLTGAKDDLALARRRLDSAVDDYDERAHHYAGRIRDAVDDGMKDSWWNDFKAWVGDADWLGDWADGLSWVATVVGLAAMLFPALGVVALALTGVVAAAHLLLAATGNGSWFDVLMDVGALKMARDGVQAAKVIKGLQQNSRTTVAGMAKESAEHSREGAMRGARRGARKGGGRSAGDRRRNRARALRMLRKNQRAADLVRDTALPQISLRERIGALGDSSLGRQMKDIQQWHTTHPAHPDLTRNALEAERQKVVLRGSWLIGTGLDISDKGGDAVSRNEYSRVKDRMTSPLSATQ